MITLTRERVILANFLLVLAIFGVVITFQKNSTSHSVSVFLGSNPNSPQQNTIGTSNPPPKSGTQPQQPANKQNEETHLAPSMGFPHIFMIVIDDLGFNDIGYASSDLSRCTPFLDSLAEKGIKMNNFYTQPTCTPSRGALMTGKYPIHLGLQHWQLEPAQPWGLPLQEKLLPEYLKSLGYVTQAVGKWHLGHYNKASLPHNRGFDGFFGFLSGGENYYTKVSEEACDKKYHKMETCFLDLWHNSKPIEVSGDNSEHNTILFTEKMKDILKQHDSSIPLFMYASYPNAHVPLNVDPDVMTRYADILDDIPNLYRREYAALLLMLDEAVEDLITTVKDEGMYDNSVIIVMSDNGGNVVGGGNNYPLRGSKQYTFEGGIRTHAFIHSPLIPKRLQGTKYNGLMHISDWLPTILEGVIGVSNPADEIFQRYRSIDGINQWDAIMGYAKDSPRHEMLINIDYLDAGGDFLGFTRSTIRIDDWKAIFSDQEISWYDVPFDAESVYTVQGTNNRFIALYNITEDPEEHNDLQALYPDVMMMMRSKLESYMKTMIKSEYINEVDPNAYEVWDSNGYVGPWVDDEIVVDANLPFRRQEYEHSIFNIHEDGIGDVKKVYPDHAQDPIVPSNSNQQQKLTNEFLIIEPIKN